MQPLKINEKRLWHRLNDMAKIGATPKGGVCRLALTEADLKSRDLFVQWCEQLQCEITVDTMGNIFARRPGAQNHLPPLLIGSHLDSQPTGGKYDGAYGVLAAMEVLETLKEHDFTTAFPIELVSWTNEEGARFAPAMLSSGVFAGVFSQEYAYARVDKDGISFENALEQIGYKGTHVVGKQEYLAALELHIEQGPILENTGNSVGIVTGVQGIRWYDLIVHGEETHAGPCPMELRKDPVPKMVGLLGKIYSLATRFGPKTRVTIGSLRNEPGVRNTVPYKVSATVDIRHPEAKLLEQLHDALQTLAEQYSEKDGVTVELKEVWHAPPVAFDKNCISAIRNATQTLGIRATEIVSGAGHDAVYLSKCMPTAMIFIPCKDGISHNEKESITPRDAADGANVLLHATLGLNNDFLTKKT